MKFFQSFFLLTLICLIAASCANHRLNYSKQDKDWNKKVPINSQIKHTMYLIGDAGNSNGEIRPALQLLQSKLERASESSSVVFLGNNISIEGMAPESDKLARINSEAQLDAQLATLKKFKGRPVFIPGNQDWANYGLKGLRRQEKYIEEKLNKGIRLEDDWENYFLPDNGCSGPELIELTEDIVLVIIDSQWYLNDWDIEPEINDACEAKSRKVFKFLMEETLRKYRRKNVVIAMHHPLYSTGPHGGHFSAKEHLLPLPIIGTIATFLRSTVGLKTDIAHHKYKDFRKDLLSGARKNGRFIIASGHEHNMAYIERDNQYQIISGVASKVSPSKLIKGAHFASGKNQGFSQLDFYGNGEVWLRFWMVDEKHPEGKEVFREKIKNKIEQDVEELITDFSEYEAHKDTVVKPLFTREVEAKGFFHNALLGRHYRDLYRQKYQMEVLDLSTFRGGMTPLKRGGGNQTNSLRLVDAKGKQFVMRSLQKDASRFLPYPFNKLSFAKPIVEDNFMSTHPFAAFAIPVLAKNIGVYHTNPKLYYVPKQPVLGIYNDEFGGAAYLLEEGPAKDWGELESFGYSKKIVSTDEVLKKLLKNHECKVDQDFVVRSRLLDLIIHDFDRHSDQWRWAMFKDKKKGEVIYRPIPRDRDQPFAKYDGILIRLITSSVPFLKQLYVYGPETKNIKWLTYGGRTFDRIFMNELTWKEWEKQIRYVQTNLSDEAIDEAFQVWPEYAYKTTGKKLAEIMKQRRDGLLNLARSHYLMVAKNVDVFGTTQKELFKVERLNEKETRVRVFELINKGRDSILVFDRIFYTHETKEIRLFGEDGKDRFHFTGKVKRGILIRAIGGLDEDHFLDESFVRGNSRKTKMYDTSEGNILRIGKEGKDLTSNDWEKNIFNKSDYHYEYDYTISRPLIGYNPDDGVALGVDLLGIKYKFKKSPYGATHRLKMSYAFATKAYAMAYKGSYVEGLGRSNLLVEGVFRGPSYVENFFGLGNDTEQTESDFDFNRIRNSLFRFKLASEKRIGGKGSYFAYGPLIERFNVEKTFDRFVTSGDSDLPSDIFSPKYFGGAEMNFHFININNEALPTRGIIFDVDVAWQSNLKRRGRSMLPLKAELTFYENFNEKESIVFASRIGMVQVLGNYEFFQAAKLGGNANLRGFRSERFSGDASFYHNNDLRIRLFKLDNSIIPISFGLSGGFDYGRVWLNGEDSDTWHYGYGGGLWIAPIDFVVISGEYFRSLEGERLVVKVGHAF